MGIGRGDSARRVIGQKPTTVAELERAVAMMRDLMNGIRRERTSERNRRDRFVISVPGSPPAPDWFGLARAGGRGSVEGASPSSGVFVLPKITRPARLRRAVISLS